MEQFENLGLGDIWCGTYRKIGLNTTGAVLAVEICLKADEHPDECDFIIFHGSVACTDMHGVPTHFDGHYSRSRLEAGEEGEDR